MKLRIINLFFLCLTLNSSTFAAQANIEQQQEQIHDLIDNNKTGEAIEYIQKNSSDDILLQAIISSIVKGNIDVLRAILKINPKIIDIQSSFQLAANLPNIEILKMLFELGGQVNQKDKDGNTPLHEAAGSFQYDNVKFVLSKGALKDLLNNKGQTPADVATDIFNAKLFIDRRKRTITDYTNAYIETLRLLGVDADI